MALTALDQNVALIVVDRRKGIAGPPFVHPIAGVVARARQLIDAITDRRAETHDDSVQNVVPRLGETGTSQAIIDLLPTRSA